MRRGLQRASAVRESSHFSDESFG